LVKEKAKLAKAATAAEKEADQAQHAFEAARLQHRAQDLARELVAGEPCPVCGQEVHTLPKVSLPSDLKAAEKDVAAAHARRKEAADVLARADRQGAVAARDEET